MKQISLLVLLVLFCCGLYGQELTPSAGTTNSSIKRIYCEELMRRARGLGEERKLKDALRVMDEIIDYDSTYARVYTEKAACLFDLDSLDECLKYCDLLDKKTGESTYSWNLRGNVYRSREAFDKALICFDSSNRIHPNANAMLDRAFTLNAIGRKDEAFNQIKDYMRFYPDDELTWYNVASLFYINNYLDSALVYTDKSLAINSSFVKALHLKGSIFYKKNDYENAILYFKNSIDGSNDTFNIKLSLVEVYIVYGKYELCQMVLNDIQNLQIDNKQKIQFKYLELITNCLTGKHTNADLMTFNNLLETKYIINWDFSKTDAWLAKATLTPQQRTLIEDITKRFKEYVGKK